MNQKGKVPDLHFSANLALNHYSRYLDPSLHYIPYFYAFFKEDGAYAHHCEWDFGDATGRYLDALILCRKMTGSHTGIVAERRLKEALEWMISDEDGLVYRPAEVPWVTYGANMFDQRSTLLGLLSWYKDTREEKPLQMIRSMIRGLHKIGVDVEDYFYLPYIDYLPGMSADVKSFDRRTCPADPCHYGGGVIILPLMLFYEETGDEEALYLAERLSRFIVYHSLVFAEDGSFWVEGYGDCDGHFHSRMATVAGILRYALKTGDDALVKWCRKVYDWACTQGTTYGLFPEGLGRKVIQGLPEEYPEVARHSEICCTTDMIHIALLLCRHVDAKYGDHAEKYVNHLLASQLRDISWVKRAEGKEDSELISYCDIPERYQGSFTGRTTANDLTNFGNYDNMGCCAAAGGRALYLLWEQMIERKEDGLCIHLWLSRECDDVSLVSNIPKQGCFEIWLHAANRIFVRIPCWLRSAEITAYADGTPIRVEYRGDWADLGFWQAGVCLCMEFPMETRNVSETFCGELYQVSWRGNVVTGISPRGQYIPLYE